MKGKLAIFKLGMMYSKNSNSTNRELVYLYPGIQSEGSLVMLMSLYLDQKSSECSHSVRRYWLIVEIPKVLQSPD